jgi:iron(III) transport system substrate-binding protein
MVTKSRIFTILGLAALAAGGFAARDAGGAGEQVLNLYSARHYATDEALYQNFTRQTGIKVNLIEGSDEQIIERARTEGANSPADVLLLVDAGRLWQADNQGLFQKVNSPLLNERLPASLRHPDGRWFGFSTRARVIIYRKGAADPEAALDYADLAEPRWKGKVCMRSGGSIYNVSLLAALMERWGQAAAERWARGVVANFAREPQGGDTDQIRAVAAGECQVAVTNTYYLVRLLKSAKPEDRKVADAIGVIWPDQNGAGTHVNVAGGGMARHAPHRQAAQKFLEFLAGDEAQRHFANANNEYPAVMALLDNPELKGLGEFKADPLNVEVYGRNQAAAQKIFDRAGWR